MTHQDLKARHKELIKEGVYYHLALRWADGHVQHIDLPAVDAYEVVKWTRAYDNFCRMAYVRDLRNGRFCRV
jgi:hypothetical protein